MAAQQELTWRISVNPDQAAAGLRLVAAEAKTSTASIEASVRQEAAAAVALQRQRSAALIALWKADTAAALAEERKRTAAAISIQREQSAAVVSLNRQRSAAIAQELKAADAVVSNSGRDLARREVQNLTADYAKFADALKNNNVAVRKGADDFLNLFAKVSGGSKELHTAEAEAHKLTEAFKVLSSTAIVADGPMGGIASRVRAIGTEANELVGVGGGPLIALTVGLAALAAGGALVSAELFKATKEAAEFGESIFKVHQKTGLAVETISALKIAGHAVGMEIGEMSTGLVRFVNNLGLAESGNKKAIATFSQLGVTAFRDPDKALEQFIDHFAKLRTDEDRTLAASAVFGARFGANLIEVFHQVGGNLEEFKTKLRESGNLMSGEAAEAAHRFTVQMHELELQVEGLERSIGQDLMPTASSAIKELTSLLEHNRDSIINWTHDVGNAATGAYVLASEITKLVGELHGLEGMTVPVVLQMLWEVVKQGTSLGLLADIGKARAAAGVTAGPPGMMTKEQGAAVDQFIASRNGPQFHTPSSGGGKGKRDTTAKDNFEAESEISRKAIADREVLYREETDRLKHEYDQRLISFDEHIAQERMANDARFNDTIDKINEEQAALDAALKKKIIKQAEYDKKNAEIGSQATKATAELHKEEGRLDEESYKQRLALHKQFIETNNAAADAADQRETTQLRRKLDNQVIDAVSYEAQLYAIKIRANEREKATLDDEIEQLIKHLMVVKNITHQEAAAQKVVTDAIVAQRAARNKNAADEDAIELAAKMATVNALQARAAAYVALDTEAANSLRVRELDQRKSDLQLLIMLVGVNAKTVALARQLSLDEAREHHNQVMDEIGAQESAARAIDVGGKHKLEIEQRYNKLRDQENKRFLKQKADEDKKAAKDAALAGPGGGFAFGLSTGQLSNLAHGVKDFADVATVAFSAVGAAVGGLAQGIGALYQNWILMGDQADISIQKMVASVLAGVASQAAVQAVLFTAYGIAALTPWGAAIYGPAPMWFEAAALMAGIALTTGLLGRATAGTAFQQAAGNTSGASSASSGGGKAGTSANNGPTVINAERNKITIEISHVHKFVGGNLHSEVEKSVIKSARGNREQMKLALKQLLK
jgi:hypothetical protein